MVAAAPTPKSVEAPSAEKNKIVSSIIQKGYESYLKTKDYALQSQVLAPAVKPTLDFVENKASDLKSMSPYKVDKVVASLDEKVADVIKYGEQKKEDLKASYETAKQRPTQLKQGTLVLIRDTLNKLSEEECGAEHTEDEELEVKDVVHDVQSIIYQQYKKVTDTPVVQNVSTKVAENVDAVLGVSEKYLEKYLPAEEGEEAKEAVATRTGRALNLSKVAGTRLQKQALAQITSLRRRTESVVHIDLMQYSALLDVEKVKGKVTPLVDMWKVTLDERVVTPVSEVTKVTVQRVVDLKKVAEKYRIAAANRVAESAGQLKTKVVDLAGEVAVPEQVSEYTTVGKKFVSEKYELYFVQTSGKIVEAFKAEVEKQKLREEKGEAQSDRTIKEGVIALLLTGHAIAAQTYDLHVAPLVSKFTAAPESIEAAE